MLSSSTSVNAATFLSDLLLDPTRVTVFHSADKPTTWEYLIAPSKPASSSKYYSLVRDSRWHNSLRFVPDPAIVVTKGFVHRQFFKELSENVTEFPNILLATLPSSSLCTCLWQWRSGRRCSILDTRGRDKRPCWSWGPWPILLSWRWSPCRHWMLLWRRRRIPQASGFNCRCHSCHLSVAKDW